MARKGFPYSRCLKVALSRVDREIYVSSTEVGDSSVIGTISQSLLPESTLAVCDDTCQTERVSVTVRLQTSHIGRGCDRDELSLRQRRHDCGKFRHLSRCRQSLQNLRVALSTLIM